MNLKIKLDGLMLINTVQISSGIMYYGQRVDRLLTGSLNGFRIVIFSVIKKRTTIKDFKFLNANTKYALASIFEQLVV
ncbi:MAG: hypothetical protein IPO72_10850 [Saprospiraceae bacterium]|nr:hypothetical protein [Candidatus Vicinibacter affinis]